MQFHCLRGYPCNGKPRESHVLRPWRNPSADSAVPEHSAQLYLCWESSASLTCIGCDAEPDESDCSHCKGGPCVAACPGCQKDASIQPPPDGLAAANDDVEHAEVTTYDRAVNSACEKLCKLADATKGFAEEGAAQLAELEKTTALLSFVSEQAREMQRKVTEDDAGMTILHLNV